MKQTNKFPPCSHSLIKFLYQTLHQTGYFCSSANTVEHRLYELIGTRGRSDKRFFQMIKQIQFHNKTTSTHMVIY